MSRQAMTMPHTPTLWQAWWYTLRPKTLSAAVGPVVIGTALALSKDVPFLWTIALSALFGSFAIQIAVNLFNDCAVSDKLIDPKSERLGPQRGVQLGLLTTRQVFVGGLISLLAAWLCSIPLLLHGGWPVVALLSCATVATYIYSHGPYPLCNSIFTDPVVFLLFGVLNLAVMSYKQGLQWYPEAFVAGAQIGLLCVAISVVNNTRDHEADRRSGRYTIPVFFGLAFSRCELAFVFAVTYLLGIYWFVEGHPMAAVLPLASMPLAIAVTMVVWTTKPSRAYNKLLALTALVHLSFSLLLAGGLLYR